MNYELLKDTIKAGLSVSFAIFIFVILLFSLFPILAKTRLWTSAWNGEADLRQAEWTKRIQVEEARGKMDASSLLAKAEIERAKGVAQANKIIGDSLKGNEGYLRYLWIESLKDTKDKVIYVPTETGLPILESTRLMKRDNNETRKDN